MGVTVKEEGSRNDDLGKEPIVATTSHDDSDWGADAPVARADNWAPSPGSASADSDDGWGADAPVAGASIPVADPPDAASQAVAAEADSVPQVGVGSGVMSGDADVDVAAVARDGDASLPDVDAPADLSSVSSAKRSKRVRQGRGPLKGVRLTADDYALISFIGRYRIATVGQLARVFDRSPKALRNRLPRLERANVLDSFFGPDQGPKMYTATDDGLAFAQMHLPGSGAVSWGLLRHYLHLTDVGVTMESAGEIVLTEREVRATSLRSEHVVGRGVDDVVSMEAASPRMQTALESLPSYEEGVRVSDVVSQAYVVPMRSGRQGRMHIPDMVLLRQPFDDGRSGNVAVEMELTRKSMSTWRAIVDAYTAFPGFASVMYYFTDPVLKRAFDQVIADVSGASKKIHTTMFAPVDMTWNPQGRQARR